MAFVKDQNIQLYYRFIALIDQNESEDIFKAVYKQTQLNYSIRKIYKKRISNQYLNQIIDLYKIFYLIDHPNIAPIYQIYEDNHHLFIVTEYFSGGNILEKIINHEIVREDKICEIIKILADIIQFCYQFSIKIINLSVKNLCFTNITEQCTLKLTIFSIPEFTTAKLYQSKSEYYTLANILHLMLLGYPIPQFSAQNFRILKIMDNLNNAQWNYLSTSAKDLIVKLLELDQKQDFKAYLIRQHPWMLTKQIQIQNPSRIYNLKKYCIQMKIQKCERLSNILISNDYLMEEDFDQSIQLGL